MIIIIIIILPPGAAGGRRGARTPPGEGGAQPGGGRAGRLGASGPRGLADLAREWNGSNTERCARKCRRIVAGRGTTLAKLRRILVRAHAMRMVYASDALHLEMVEIMCRG